MSNDKILNHNMLSTAIKPFKKELFDVLTSDVVKQAFENALLATFPTESQNCETTQYIAESFGDVAASYLGAIAEPLADAIDKYIREIGITLTPQGLVGTHGPVSGTTGPSTFTIS